MASLLRIQLQQLSDAPLARALLLSAGLHSAAFALWTGQHQYMGNGYLAEHPDGAYSAVRAIQPRFTVNFREDHEGRHPPEASEMARPLTTTPQLAAQTGTPRRVSSEAPRNGPQRGEQTTPGRGGGSDCWVNGFRFCSSGG